MFTIGIGKTLSGSSGRGASLAGKMARAASVSVLAGLMACALPLAALAEDATGSITLKGDGLLRTRSAYSVEETAKRIRADIEAKGIKFFAAIDQSQLGHDAGIDLPPSQLLLFGNPPLGVLFLTSNPESGMDWPVRILVHQDQAGVVWVVYQGWDWVSQRYAITNRTAEFAKATEVVASIVSSVADCATLADCTK